MGHDGVGLGGGADDADHGVDLEAQLVVELEIFPAGVKLADLAVFHQVVEGPAGGAGPHEAGGVQVDLLDLDLEDVAGLGFLDVEGAGGGVFQGLFPLKDRAIGGQTVVIAVAGLKNHGLAGVAAGRRGIFGAVIVGDVFFADSKHNNLLLVPIYS